MDVAPDLRAVLAAFGQLGPVVGRDGACGNVRVLADLGVADVREVRHLRAVTDARVLHLDEGACLGTRSENSSRAEVGERTYRGPWPDLRVDEDRMRPDFRTRANDCLAAQDGEGMDYGVGLDFDGLLDPRRRRVEDRHAGEHVPLEQTVAQLRRRLRQLSPVVDAEAHDRVRRTVHGPALSVSDDLAHRVGEVELALCVVALETCERRPEIVGREQIDRSVELTHG
jgi:hypothetical protein